MNELRWLRGNIRTERFLITKFIVNDFHFGRFRLIIYKGFHGTQNS